jgi:hypothetical protein
MGQGLELKGSYENKALKYSAEVGQESYGVSSTNDLTKNTYFSVDFFRKFGNWFKAGFGVKSITTEKSGSGYTNSQTNAGLKVEADF